MKKKKRAIRAYRPKPQPAPMTLYERYGRAYLKLEGWEWDELAGPKPEGFDQMTNEQKVQVCTPKRDEFYAIIGDVYANYLQWTVDRQASEESWIEYRRRMYLREKTQLYPVRQAYPIRYVEQPIEDAWNGKNSKRSRDAKLSKLPTFFEDLFGIHR